MTVDLLKNLISKEKKTIEEIISLMNYLKNSGSDDEKNMVSAQLSSLKASLKKTKREIQAVLEKTTLSRPLISEKKESIKKEVKEKKPVKKNFLKTRWPFQKSGNIKTTVLEKRALKRMGDKEKEVVDEKTKKPNKYVKMSSRIFSKTSMSLVKKNVFKTLRSDLIKSNIQFVPASYVSVILFTTMLSAIFGVFIFVFLLFFNLGAEIPFITPVTEGIGTRFLKVFWILFAVPIMTCIIICIYPSLERRITENKINQELPFATIHMSAISGSMIDPSKIFSILISTKEYPYIQKEFTKLINEINVHGYDLVTALRRVSINSPSAKLSELYNGLVTTINSGGDLPNFFSKRAQTLLFEHRLEREKNTKSAETFMDIYISVVIAAPMILMLLLMMMKISGLGLSLSTSMISLIMVLGISIVNIAFLTFLHLRQSRQE